MLPERRPVFQGITTCAAIHKISASQAGKKTRFSGDYDASDSPVAASLASPERRPVFQGITTGGSGYNP